MPEEEEEWSVAEHATGGKAEAEAEEEGVEERIAVVSISSKWKMQTSGRRRYRWSRVPVSVYWSRGLRDLINDDKAKEMIQRPAPYIDLFAHRFFTISPSLNLFIYSSNGQFN